MPPDYAALEVDRAKEGQVCWEDVGDLHLHSLRFKGCMPSGHKADNGMRQDSCGAACSGKGGALFGRVWRWGHGQYMGKQELSDPAFNVSCFAFFVRIFRFFFFHLPSREENSTDLSSLFSPQTVAGSYKQI